jgi:DNA-directed RNA polymerase subunit RPC12/RpoP
MDIDKLMEMEGYIFLGAEKISSRKKFKYICPNGHKHSIRKDHWINGSRCPYCEGNAKLTIEHIRSELNKEGYELLTTEYINSGSKLLTICPRGHNYSISWNNWSQGYRCSTCSNRVKKNQDIISNEIEKEGYSLLYNNYHNNKEKLIFKCPNNHEYEVSWSNWISRGSRCTKCSLSGTSIQENDLFAFVFSICGDAIRFDRKIINPYELDIVIPSKKVAIEYCGLYWHSEIMGKDRDYHVNKRKMCEDSGYLLITIFEDELINKRDIVFSRLKSILDNSLLNKIYARKCVISTIDSKESYDFCNDNHIQGYSVGTFISLGAFYNNELVGVMTLSKPSIAKGYKSYSSKVLELSRFCTKLDCRVIGLFSKMLKFFNNTYGNYTIFSYADCRWSSGNLYDRNGFKFVGVTKPNYWYFKQNNKRFHRFALRKTKDESKSTTEWDLRRAQGWNRIWDCGNLKFVLKNNN